MFLLASLTRHAKYAKLSRVLCVFFAIQCLLALPMGIMLIRTPPNELYPRFHGGPNFELFDRTLAREISVQANELGFVSSITFLQEEIMPAVFDTINYESGLTYRVILATRFDAWEDEGVDIHSNLFAITPQYIFYRDRTSFLAVPTRLIPAWVIEEMNYNELFNHLALYNRYFTSIVAPVFLLIFIVFFIAQALMYGAAVWLFGFWVKLSGNMSVKERFAVCAFASVPAGLAGFIIGLFIPVLHVFISQLIMIYVSYKAIKDFWNA
jgi:hypothetical protein